MKKSTNPIRASFGLARHRLDGVTDHDADPDTGSNRGEAIPN
jgi:hypothetical protein